jgi:2-dehydro-3-deoxyglucarate aldolase
MSEDFKRKLKNGDLLIGTIITLSSPEIGEIYSNSGFDWLFIDLEHSVLSMKDAQMILQSTSSRTPCLVRVPSLGETWIKQALDIGATGIIIPNIKTPEEAREAVRLCKYPPLGTRGIGVARAQGYGATLLEYASSANADTAVVIQIEHKDAVKNLADILQVPGIDCLFIGPLDLSASLGKTGLTSAPEVQEAIMQVRNGAKKVGMPLGIFCASIEAARSYSQSGFSLLAVGIDTVLISQAAKDILSSLK